VPSDDRNRRLRASIAIAGSEPIVVPCALDVLCASRHVLPLLRRQGYTSVCPPRRIALEVAAVIVEPPVEERVRAAFGPEEVGLATRNHGMPLEALRYDVTPSGLHYLLIHFDVPAVDAGSWRLEVGGAVERPMSLSLLDLRGRPADSRAVTLECAGNGRALVEPRPVSQPWGNEAVGTAVWTGVPLRDVLAEAVPSAGAVEVVFAALDRGIDGGIEQDYARSLSLQDAWRQDVLLAWNMNGEPLPPQHGNPLRLVVPGWYGMASVKWLRSITVVETPFLGYQMSRAYRMRTVEEEPGTPVTRMNPRSLMEPPGIPDFLTRERFVAPGPCELRGRTWSGWGAVERVEVSADGGTSWEEASLGAARGPAAWRPWTFTWDASPGVYELCCRATDSAGNTQPLDPPWNLGGYGNNAIQRVHVTVREPALD
jgi:sulfane dehydrogenase subunit SoxC